MDYVYPSYVLTGAIDYNFIISGRALGVQPLDLPSSVSVGGYPCPTVALVNSTALLCEGLSGRSAWLSTEVSVEIGGRRAVNAEILETFAAPRLAAVFPEEGNTSGAYWIEVASEQQGRMLEDVLGVTIGGVDCLDLEWVNAASLRCLVPPGVGS